jgi:hypothetical protein
LPPKQHHKIEKEKKKEKTLVLTSLFGYCSQPKKKRLLPTCSLLAGAEKE